MNVCAYFFNSATGGQFQEVRTMIKKVLLVSLVLFGIMSFQIAGDCFAATGDTLDQAKQNVISLIDAGQYATAESATNKLVSDFSGNKGLPEALYWIAERFERFDKFEESNQINRQIIQNYTNNPWAGKATLGISRANIKSLITSNKYESAKTALNKFIADFAGNPDLPEAIFWIAERFQRFDRFEDAKENYQRIIKDFPDSPLAAKSKFWFARVNVLSLIKSQDYDGAKSALDEFISNFAGDSDYAESLYWIAEQYKWLKQYKEANAVYQQIIQRFPGSKWALKAAFGASKAEVLSLIKSQDYDRAKSAVDKLSSDFAGNPDLPETLYWIAWEYNWSKRFKDATGIYQQIIEKYPNNALAEKAKLGAARTEVFSLIDSQNYKGAESAVDKLSSDFAGNPDLPETLYWIADSYRWSNNFAQAKNICQQVIQKDVSGVWAGNAKFAMAHSDALALLMSGDYDRAEESLNKLASDFAGNPDLARVTIIAGEQFYKAGLVKDSRGLEDEAKSLFERAVKIWDRAINTYPNSILIPEACCWAGDCYQKLGRYEESIRHFQIIVNSYPQYEYAWHAQFVIGTAYQRMKEAGTISESEADSKTKTAYQQLISKWPGCDNAGSAQTWLNEHN
jgi:TolA-binding protein